jgi:uracil-DNA glycosylase
LKAINVNLQNTSLSKYFTKTYLRPKNLWRLILNSSYLKPPYSFIEPSWQIVLKEELEAPYMAELAAFVHEERQGSIPIYPPKELVFNAFFKTPFKNVKVVVLGQDPYHGPGQAHGLSFSVPRGVTPPPSLKNIFKELKSDVGVETPSSGCLDQWAEQGVFLLNSILTVRQNTPLSHQKKGWERFTDAVIMKLLERSEPLVFLLWGKYAQDKCHHFSKTSNQHHLLLKATHPSPFSAHYGFLGCHHFSKANEFLKSKGIQPIDWRMIV